jgi:hypothetical protein
MSLQRYTLMRRSGSRHARLHVYSAFFDKIAEFEKLAVHFAGSDAQAGHFAQHRGEVRGRVSQLGQKGGSREFVCLVT